MMRRKTSKLFRTARHAEQLRQEFARAPKRMQWGMRLILQVVSNSIALWMMFGFLGVFFWMCDASWPERLSQRLVGWSFPLFWVTFMLVVPSLWFSLVSRVFSGWFSEDEVTFTSEADRIAQSEQERAWQAEDVADDARWIKRVEKAGMMALAGDVSDGQVSLSEDGKAADEAASETDTSEVPL